MAECLDSSFNMMTKPVAGHSRSRNSLPSRGTYITLLHSLHTGTRPIQPCIQRRLFPGSRVADAWHWVRPYNEKIRNWWSYTTIPFIYIQACTNTTLAFTHAFVKPRKLHYLYPYFNTKKFNQIRRPWPLKVGPIICPETSVRNYHYSLRNSPEDRISTSYTL